MDIDINLKILAFNWKISISKQWVRFGIVVAVMLVSTTIAFWGSMKQLLLLLVLVGGMVGIATLIRQPNLGFLLIFLGAIFVPFVGPGGVNATALIVALMLGLWILDFVAVKRGFYFVRSRIMLPATVFLVIAILAFGMGQIPWFVFAHQAPLDAQAGGFAIFVLSVSTLLIAGHVVQDERWLQIIVWTFIALGAIYIGARTLKFSRIDRLYQSGFTAGSMFWTWLVALSLSQAIFNNKLKPYIRVLLIALVALTFYVAIRQAYTWKSGWMPPLAVVGVILSLKYRKLLILAIPLGLGIAYSLATQAVSAEEYSWGTRLDAWKIVLEISKVSPWIGMGFANYYWYTPLFAIRGWSVNFNSHSQYVDLIAQVGVLGLICFLWMFFELGRISWRLSQRLPDGFARAYTHGVLAGIIGSLVAGFLVDWVLPFVYNIGFAGFRASILPWVFLGGLLSVEQLYLRKTEI